MKHNVPEANYGLPFIFFFLVNLLAFIGLILEIEISFLWIIGIGIMASFLLAFLDNKLNSIKSKSLYLCYFIAGAIDLYILKYTFDLMSGQTISMPRIFFVALLAVGIVPGYFLIKMFQNFINNKLHKEYWDKFEKK